MRPLEKYAVRCGGGANKRMGLYDVAMVKDNHVAAAGSVAAAVAAVRERAPRVSVQVEVDTPAQAVEAVEAGADFLLCDNMPPAVLAKPVANVGVAIVSQARGVSIQARFVRDGDENRVTGNAGYPWYLNPYGSRFGAQHRHGV